MAHGRARAIGVAGLVLAVALVGVVLLGDGSGGYRVRVLAQDAGQLVKGNLVKIGGVKVGVVDRIELASDNQAAIDLKFDDTDLVPLHEGTRAEVRSTSLSAVAGRIVALHPGPNDAPEIADGGTIRAEDTQAIVDLDAVINTLDAETRTGLQDLIHGGATAFAKDRGAGNRGLRALSPALSQTRAALDELLRDEPTFERFLVEAAAVVGAVAPRSADIEEGVADAAITADAVARQADSLDEALRLAPGTLRRANTTLVNARGAVRDLRPAVREAAPVAPRLARLVDEAAPVVRRARPVVAGVRSLLPDASAVLRGLPALDRIARPAISSTVGAVSVLQDKGVVNGVRAYLPDVVSGFFNGFGGNAGSSYDANGHYVRISLQTGPKSLQNGLSALLPAAIDSDIFRYRANVRERCPGGATQAAPDGSNPWLTATPCKAEDALR